MTTTTPKVGRRVNFTTPKNRWEPRTDRTGTITVLVSEHTALVRDPDGTLFVVPLAKMTTTG